MAVFSVAILSGIAAGLGWLVHRLSPLQISLDRRQLRVSRRLGWLIWGPSRRLSALSEVRIVDDDFEVPAHLLVLAPGQPRLAFGHGLPLDALEWLRDQIASQAEAIGSTEGDDTEIPDSLIHLGR